MGKYHIGFSDFATTTAFKTAVKIIGASAKKFEVVEASMHGSHNTNPGQDIQHEARVGFLTNATAGTPGVSPTPEKMDQGMNNASAFTVGTNYSAEPTAYNTNKFALDGMNQRSGCRFAVPKGEGFKTQGDATALSWAMGVISGVAGAVGGKIMWWED